MKHTTTRSRLLRATIAGSASVLLALTAVGPSASAAGNDADQDGIPNRWENSHGLDPHNAADATRDPDHDGLVNRGEYRNDGLLRDEDSDNDGQDDGDEVRTDTELDDRDSDDDGRLDGHEDADSDGVHNEDEDDARETCAFDDDDKDSDDVDDEDENELDLEVGDSDSDDDGLDDGSEDSDDDGVSDEDEDDSDSDRCDGDRDGDGEDDEDERDLLGTVISFTDSTLVVQTVHGFEIQGVVTADTEVDFEDEDGADDQEATTASLQPGVQVAEIEFDDDLPTVIEEVEIYSAGGAAPM